MSILAKHPVCATYSFLFCNQLFCNFIISRKLLHSRMLLINLLKLSRKKVTAMEVCCSCFYFLFSTCFYFPFPLPKFWFFALPCFKMYYCYFFYYNLFIRNFFSIFSHILVTCFYVIKSFSPSDTSLNYKLIGLGVSLIYFIFLLSSLGIVVEDCLQLMTNLFNPSNVNFFREGRYY